MIAVNPSEWTPETLRAVFEQHLQATARLQLETDRRYEERFQASQQALGAALIAAEKAVNAALAAADRAVSKAEAASERRFEGVNEFRSTLSDQAATLLSRAEGDVRFNGLVEACAAIADRINKLELAQSTNVRRDDIAKISNDIEKLRDTQTASAGKQSAYAVISAAAFALMALIVSIIGIFYHPSLPVVLGTSSPPSVSATVTAPAPPR